MILSKIFNWKIYKYSLIKWNILENGEKIEIQIYFPLSAWNIKKIIIEQNINDFTLNLMINAAKKTIDELHKQYSL